MEEARLKKNLPQEGTGLNPGESLPEHCSGSPTYSGGGKGLLTKELPTDKPKKILTQQVFHPGLFNRQRAASISEVTERKSESNLSEPWQQIPAQKRNRSPDEKDSRTNQAKRTQRRNQIHNTHRGLNNQEPNSNSDIETRNSFDLLDVEEADIPVKRLPKPPPIILYGVDDLRKLTETIEEVVGKEDFTYKIVSKNQLIISTNTVEKYKLMIEHIRPRA